MLRVIMDPFKRIVNKWTSWKFHEYWTQNHAPTRWKNKKSLEKVWMLWQWFILFFSLPAYRWRENGKVKEHRTTDLGFDRHSSLSFWGNLCGTTVRQWQTNIKSAGKKKKKKKQNWQQKTYVLCKKKDVWCYWVSERIERKWSGWVRIPTPKSMQHRRTCLLCSSVRACVRMWCARGVCMWGAEAPRRAGMVVPVRAGSGDLIGAAAASMSPAFQWAAHAVSPLPSN